MFFIFSTNPRFPHFYYRLGANLGLLLYGEVSVMQINLQITRRKAIKINDNGQYFDFIGGTLSYVTYIMS